MTIYVDPPMTEFGRRFDNWCHMFSDGDDTELIDFATSIGLKPEWLQAHNPRFHHFDLSPAKRAEAVRRGAVEVTRRRMVEINLAKLAHSRS